MDRYRPRWCSKCKAEVEWVRVSEMRGRRKVSKKRCRICNWPTVPHRPKYATPKSKADALWSALVKRPQCCYFAGREVGGKMHVCAGELQAMHGIPRGYYGTRYMLANGFCGCAGVHTYYTNRKEAWAAWLVNEWGLEKFNEMWGFANGNTKKWEALAIEFLNEMKGLVAA